MFKKIVLLLVILILSASAQGEEIFPDLLGEELLEALVGAYKPYSVLSYGDARDVMYGQIYNEDDYLSGVYTGYTIYMDPNADPSEWAYSNGINCEHTWPQSKGAIGNAKSDMHHLFPTRVEANSARGNDPFAESPDSQTDKWFRDDYYVTYIPSQFIEEYSEDNDGAYIFEPREDHKGNAARSCFYFYTMYKDEADAADPEFFTIQKDVLFQWHQDDPTDDLEQERTQEIADYQDDKPNPFVLDPSLVIRAYFPEIYISVEDENIISTPKFCNLKQNYPNPFNPETTIGFELTEKVSLNLNIYDVNGNLVKNLVEGETIDCGYHTCKWDGKDNAGNKVNSGIYFYKIETENFRYTKQMLLLK